MEEQQSFNSRYDADRQLKDTGRVDSGTTSGTGSSADLTTQTWLETLGDEDEDTLLNYFLGEEEESGNGNTTTVNLYEDQPISTSHDVHMNGALATTSDHCNVPQHMAAASVQMHEITQTEQQKPLHISQTQPLSNEGNNKHVYSSFPMPLNILQTSSHHATPHQVQNTASFKNSPASSLNQDGNVEQYQSQRVPNTPAIHFYSHGVNDTNHSYSIPSPQRVPQKAQSSPQNHPSLSAAQKHKKAVASVEKKSLKKSNLPKLNANKASIQYPIAPSMGSGTSSSSSSLSLQGLQGSTPILHVHQQFAAQSGGGTPNVTNMSPMSPTAMMTNEVLMLPGTGVRTTTSASNSNAQNKAVNSNQQSQTQHPALTQHVQSHHWGAMNAPQNRPVTSTNGSAPPANNANQLPAWIQHMNNVAALANQGGIPAPVTMTSTNYAQTHQTTPANSTSTHTMTNNFPAQPIHFFPGHLGSTLALSHRFFKEDNVVESKEKREKRLARNRESARQSRKRKKELLLNLRQQVNRLYDQIEEERKLKLECMERDLNVECMKMIKEIYVDMNYSRQQNPSSIDSLVHTIRSSGPNIEVRRCATQFQCKSLKKAILPPYSQLLFALSLNDDEYFTNAKHERIRQTQKPSGRISSRMVGEDMMKKHNEDTKQNKDDKTLNCLISEKEKFWPLLCSEISVGIDQEEKLLYSLKNIHNILVRDENDSKIAAATSMVETIEQSILLHSASVASRNETALLQILTPVQSIRFMEWFIRNKDRCKKVLKKDFEMPGNTEPGRLPKVTSDQSLGDFCKLLTDNLKIKRENSSM